MIEKRSSQCVEPGRKRFKCPLHCNMSKSWLPSPLNLCPPLSSLSLWMKGTTLLTWIWELPMICLQSFRSLNQSLSSFDFASDVSLNSICFLSVLLWWALTSLSHLSPIKLPQHTLKIPYVLNEWISWVKTVFRPQQADYHFYVVIDRLNLQGMHRLQKSGWFFLRDYGQGQTKWFGICHGFRYRFAFWEVESTPSILPKSLFSPIIPFLKIQVGVLDSVNMENS